MESNSQSYLMELKRQLWKRLRLSQVLSIVPYGIETKHICFNFIVKASSQSYLMELKLLGAGGTFKPISLSIVPYGIETWR